MASLPSFDPADPGRGPREHLNNRIIMDRMEPGSTFKIVTIAAALNEGIANLSTPFDCEQGAWFHAGRILHDAGSHKYGLLSLEEILAKSSNIGTAKIALQLGEARLYHYARAFGFGSKTGITLGGENGGKVREVDDWDKLTLSRMPMGQGVAVTHLQMIMAMSAIANGGVLMRPMIVRQLVDKQGHVFAHYPPQRVAQVVSEETARQTTLALKSVVSQEGTAKAARLEYYTVGGKTGTAQKPDLVHGGYLAHEDIHSFLGFLPADQPEICLSVVIDAPKTGRYASQTAAPTFGRMAEMVARHLKIRPDKTSSTSLMPPPGTGLDQGLVARGVNLP
jgi:cell division protein FtsI/penicillin-binding protein 2